MLSTNLAFYPPSGVWISIGTFVWVNGEDRLPLCKVKIVQTPLEIGVCKARLLICIFNALGLAFQTFLELGDFRTILLKIEFPIF